MVFNSLYEAREYVKATRIGDLYTDDICYQSAIYEVEILDRNNLSALKQGVISITEEIPDTISRSHTRVIYVETSLDNLKPLSAKLFIDSLYGVYEHPSISMSEEQCLLQK